MFRSAGRTATVPYVGVRAKQLLRSISIGPTDGIFLHRQPDQPDSFDRQSIPSTGAGKGPLSAWRVSLKDNICTADMPTTCASRMLDAYSSPFDATVVAILRAAGAHLIGKTNCDEFGMGSTGVESAYGVVINPAGQQDAPMRVAGGSSSGAAASVASGQCRIALGSDTGGSVRLPAAYCGVYGLKPSYGLLSRWGLVSYADSLDTIGIIASSSGDLRTTIDTLAHFDAKDPTSASSIVRRRAERIVRASLANVGHGNSLRGLRVGVPHEFFAAEVNSDNVMPAVRRALGLLRDAGAEIVSVRLASVRYALSAYYVLASAEASSNLARYDGIRFGYRSPASEVSSSANFARQIAQTRSEVLGKEVQRRLLLGTYSLTSDYFDNYFLQAQRVRHLVQQDFDRVFCLVNPLSAADDVESPSSSDGVHILLHPSTVDIAPTVEEAKRPVLSTYTQDLLTVPASLAGVPAVSVPMGRAQDMPVGVSLTTQWGCEPILWHVLQQLGP